MPKQNNIELKNASSNWERKLLGILDEQKTNLKYGRINIDVVVNNGKVVLVELQATKKTYKID